MSPRSLTAFGVLLTLLLGAAPTGAAATSSPPPTSSSSHPSLPSAHLGDAAPRWAWPVDGTRTVNEPFRAPAHEYGAGHRGVDIGAGVGVEVRSPDDGVVAFRGVVVDRALITIAHPGGLVSTLEPVSSELEPGSAVHAGEVIGVVAPGGHTAPGDLHVGARRAGVYINPMLLFGEVERAVLLPCCT